MDAPERTSDAVAGDTSRAAERRRTVPMDAAADRASAQAPRSVAQAAQAAHAEPAGVPSLRGETLASRLGTAGNEARFEFTGMLGMGASGEVFAVYDRDLQRPIAVKMLRTPAQAEGADLGDFLEEARITAGLSHPNVLPVLDIDLARDGRPCFSMSRIDGTTLGEIIAGSTTGAPHARLSSPNAVVTIFIAICHAIAYAHSRGIVHQDIKPDNVLLGSFGEVLVLDWGSAGRLGPEGRITSRLYGTPLYMSPEQAESSHCDARSDVYGLGASLFHALTLRPPTWDDDDAAFWRKKRAGVIDEPSRAERATVPAPLLSIALTALARDPARRYASVALMAADLEQFQAGLAVSVHHDSPWAVLRRWYRANRRLSWTVAAAVLVLGTMVAALLHERAKDRSDWTLVAEERFDDGWQSRWRGYSMVWGAELPQPLPPGDRSCFTAVNAGVDVSIGFGCADLSYRDPLLGDLRVEWDYTPLERNTDLNCFIEGEHRLAGYTFHVGGWGDPASLVLTKGASIEVLERQALPAPLTVKRTYHMRMEKEGDAVRLAVDGATVIDYHDLEPGAPDSGVFGFDAIDHASNRVEHLRIWHKPLAQRITPIAYARKLLQLERYPQAYAQFADILANYAGTELAPEALYGQAVCRVREGRSDEALQRLDEFDRRFPGHALAPYCLRERLAAMPLDAEPARRERVLRQLVVFAGHPAVRAAAVRQAEAERAQAFPWLMPKKLGDPCYSEQAVERTRVAAKRLRRDLGVLGVAIADTSFMPASVKFLDDCGHDEVVLELYPDQRGICATALLHMGRYAELLERYPEQIEQAGEALLELGRLDEVIAGTSASWTRREAMLLRDGPEAMLRAFPDHPDSWLMAGRPDEALAKALDVQSRARVLHDIGRDEEALALAPTTWLKISVLTSLHRYERALELSVGDDRSAYACASYMIEHGEERGGREVIAKLADVREVMVSNSSVPFQRFLLPLLLANRDGDTVDAAAALRELLDERRWIDHQRPWHLAAFLAGRIDEAGFRAQPCRLGMDSRVHVARGMRCELAHDWTGAIAAYTAGLAPPHSDRLLRSSSMSDYVVWRRDELIRRGH